MEGAGQALSKRMHPLHLEEGVGGGGEDPAGLHSHTSAIIDTCQFLRLSLLLKLSCKTGGKS